MSRLSAKEKIRCTLFLFLIGGGLYNLIEILWRGFTHWTMFIVGGLCFLVIGRIHETVRRGMVIRCTLCALAITLIEFVSGCLFNILLKMDVWDYSFLMFNIMGQVSLLYTVLWGLLSAAAFPVYRFFVGNLTCKAGGKRTAIRIPAK
ncbi:MAG TPA: hypothetical protein GXX54_06785 [Clostridiales bacterium]|nr:hypothetical protein [Clostridiales bacterium]